MPRLSDIELVQMVTADLCQNTWELKFVSAMRAKLTHKGENFDLSKKQRECIRKILFVPNRAHLAKREQQESEKRAENSLAGGNSMRN